MARIVAVIAPSLKPATSGRSSPSASISAATSSASSAKETVSPPVCGGACAAARVGGDHAKPARERVEVGRVRDRNAGPAQAARDEPAVQEQQRPASSPLEVVNVDPVCTDHLPALKRGFHVPSVGAELAPVDPAFAGSFSYGVGAGEQAVLDGEHAGLRPVRSAGLRVDVLDVAARSLGRDDQLSGDLLVREAAREQPEHLDLAGGETRRPLTPARHTVPGGTQDRARGVAVEAAFAHLGANDVRRLLPAPGRPMRPRLRQRLVDIGRREQSRSGCDHPARQPARIAGPVQPLVMLDGDRANRRQRRGERKHPLASGRGASGHARPRTG